MYKIEFDPSFGKFVIEILKHSFIWKRVHEDLVDPPLPQASKKLLTFDTFSEAESYVSRIGLDKLYQDRSSNKYREYREYHSQHQQRLV